MAGLDKYLKLNDTINSIINHTIEESGRINDSETESLIWEKMWNDIDQVERYYNSKYY